MLTKIKKTGIHIQNWWAEQYIYWIYLQTWYLIKFRKMRHLKLDWAMTQKFFRYTFASFYIAKYFSHSFFYSILHLKYYNFKFNNLVFILYYKLVKYYYWYDQFIEISFTTADQYNRWILLDQLFLVEFPYYYDKMSRKKRWSKLIRHWAKKYILTLKYYSGKITSFKESE